MRIVTLDFETAYSKDYTLKSLSTEEYITDPRFQIIGFSYKIQDSPAIWVPARVESADLSDEINDLDLPHSALLCHNARFDGLILAHHFGVFPKFYLDTYSMANAVVRPFTDSSSLESVANYLAIGQKGTAVQDYMGKWRSNFTAEELAIYGEYCNNDTELTYKAFMLMKPNVPKAELRAINRTLRLYLQPKFMLDTQRLIRYHAKLLAETQLLIATLPAGMTKARLVSNKQFAEYLISRGIQPDKKTTIRKNGQLKQTDALGKKDPFMMRLLVHEDRDIATLAAARIRLKSNIHEKRSERLIKIAATERPFRIPLVYAGAHTLRWSGDEGINAQNFPKGLDGKPSEIRSALVAPPGHVVIAADLAQIEARLIAYVAGELKLIELFATDSDVYADFASRIYGHEVNETDFPQERFVGKVGILSLGYGAGPTKLQLMLLGYGVKIPLGACSAIVEIYRNTYGSIKTLWKTINRYLESMLRGAMYNYPVYSRCNLGGLPAFFINGNSIILPGGAKLHYPKLHIDQGEYRYGDNNTKIYGGSLTENIIQALARVLLLEHIIALEDRGINIAHTVHDELIFIEPEEAVEAKQRIIHGVMTKPPIWAPTLPVSVKINVGRNYGECK